MSEVKEKCVEVNMKDGSSVKLYTTFKKTDESKMYKLFGKSMEKEVLSMIFNNIIDNILEQDISFDDIMSIHFVEEKL